MDSKGYYKILDLQPGANIKDVKKAFLKKQAELHPSGKERNKLRKSPEYIAMTEEQRKAKESELDERVAAVNEAYAVLQDEKKKKDYDEGAGEFGEFAGFSGFEDIFSNFTQGRRRAQHKGKDIVTDIVLTFKESFLGKTSKYRIKCSSICSTCNGEGGKNMSTCSRCKGQGFAYEKVSIGGIFQTTQQIKCSACDGKGTQLVAPFCSGCKGDKIIQDVKLIEVVIKPGIEDGKRIIFTGQGNQYPGAINGDIVFNIVVKDDPNYKRIDDDIVTIVPVDILTILTGGFVYFDHLDGKKLAVKVNPLKDMEQVFCLPNEGFISSKTSKKCNLYLKPKILVNNGLDRTKLSEYLKPLTAKPAGEYTNISSNLSHLPQDTHDHSEQESDQGHTRFFRQGMNMSDFFSFF